MKKALFISLFFGMTNLLADVKTVLIFGGKSGWIGQEVVAIVKNCGQHPICAESRLEDRAAIIAEITRIQPDCIINAAGITGKPTVDWCEDHKQETIRTNIIGTLNLVDIAYMHNLHVTNVSTGCIYEYDAQHPMKSGIGFTEQEAPNFKGSFYSRGKILLEALLLEYPNVLNLRLKMPVATDLIHGFVGKIIKYKKIINVPNSMCVLEDLLPIAVDMTLRQIKGNYNFVNPGAISHHEVLELYKQYIDPVFTYESFTLEEQDRILKVPRSNAELSADKLLKLYPDIPHIKDSLAECFKIIKKRIQKPDTTTE